LGEKKKANRIVGKSRASLGTNGGGEKTPDEPWLENSWREQIAKGEGLT